MANRFRSDPVGIRFVLVTLLALAVIVVDATSAWFDTPRNVLSVLLRPVQQLASVPQSIAQSFASLLDSEPDVKVAYDNLREEYFQLKAQSLLLEGLAKENDKLRALLGASPRLRESIVLAAIVNADIDRDNHTFVVAKGLRDGIYQGQAVIDDQGVVGQVTEAMPLTSSVALITDPGHALPGQIERNGLRAVVQGTGLLNELKVPFFNINSDIQEGDLILSSGLGGRFPAGYPVARVSSVRVVDDSAFIDVRATPIARLEQLTSVLILSREANAGTP